MHQWWSDQWLAASSHFEEIPFRDAFLEVQKRLTLEDDYLDRFPFPKRSGRSIT